MRFVTDQPLQKKSWIRHFLRPINIEHFVAVVSYVQRDKKKQPDWSLTGYRRRGRTNELFTFYLRAFHPGECTRLVKVLSYDCRKFFLTNDYGAYKLTIFFGGGMILKTYSQFS